MRLSLPAKALVLISIYIAISPDTSPYYETSNVGLVCMCMKQ